MSPWLLPLHLLACSGADSPLLSLEAEVDDQMPTVVKVSWELSEEAEAWVEYGIAPDCDRVTNSLVGLVGTVPLLGIPPVEDVCYRLVMETEDSQYTSEEGEVRTGNVPVSAPPLTVEIFDEEAMQPGYLVGAMVVQPSNVFVIDRYGNYVWYYEIEQHHISTQAQLSLDGKGFVHNRFHRTARGDESWIQTVGFDGGVSSEISTPDGHHAFQQLPDGGYAYLAIDVRDVDENGLMVGDKLMEMDPDGVETEVWNVWDHQDEIPLVYYPARDVDFYSQGKDWTHGNFVYYRENNDSYTISFRNMDTIVELDAATGEHLLAFGAYGTYELGELSNQLGDLHSARWTDDDTLLFFTSPRGMEISYGVELVLDDDGQQVLSAQTHGKEEEQVAKVLGESYRLENGNTFVNFGSKGIMLELNPAGEVIWRLTIGAGNFAGHTEIVPSLYSSTE